MTTGSETDHLTFDPMPTLHVSAEPDAKLVVGQNGVETDTPYYVIEDPDAPGSYTITFTGELADGTYGVRVIDEAGNKSALADGPQPYKFVIDTTAPQMPVITAIDENSGNTTDRLTNDSIHASWVGFHKVLKNPELLPKIVGTGCLSHQRRWDWST